MADMRIQYGKRDTIDGQTSIHIMICFWCLTKQVNMSRYYRMYATADILPSVPEVFLPAQIDYFPTPPD